MKRNIILLFTLLSFSFTFSQSNKFDEFQTSKKLGMYYKNVKDKDKDDYFQQFYWLLQSEKLGSYSFLKTIKPKILYEFVKEINPINPVKEFTPEQKELRQAAEHSLNQYLSKKDFANSVFVDNLNTYVDPSGDKYNTEVNPERVATLLPKTLYTFTTFNKKNKNQKTYYLWVDQNKDKYKIVDLIPSEKDKKFYSQLKIFMPNYKFPEFVPAVKMGDKRVKSDADYFYITPFQVGNDNIIYKTKNFEDYQLVSYKKQGGPWTDIDIKLKK